MIKVGIVGYGNLGKACEKIAVESEEFDLIGIFTRREPSFINSPYNSLVYRQNEIFDKDIDVVILCVGSANELQDTAFDIAPYFNTVDTYDNHRGMKDYVTRLDQIAKSSGKLCFVGMGWDPGIFSLMRALLSGIGCKGYETFWGKGVSQGHSNAIKNIEGVENAIEYTIPRLSALDCVKRGDFTKLKDTDKHIRECFVVLKDDVDKNRVKKEIITMPSYFLGYETIVHFIDKKEFDRNHKGCGHGGKVVSVGKVNGHRTECEFSLAIDSNPHFTASIAMAYARANYIMSREGHNGAKTIIDLPISYLLSQGREDNISQYI